MHPSEFKTSLTVDIGAELEGHLETALVRFGYLHPTIAVSLIDGVTLSAQQGVDLESAARDLRFELYRQKIFQETLPLRSAMISGVMKP